MTILTPNSKKHRKAYKQKVINNSNMFPGDPSGSPDAFYVILGGLR